MRALVLPFCVLPIIGLLESADAQPVDCQALKQQLSSPRVLNGSPKMLEAMANEYDRFCSAITGPAITSAARDGSQPASLWNHNDSVMTLYARGNERIFRYEKPRDQIRQEGVQKGTILFSGTKDGDTYQGTAYIFHRNCDPIRYAVSGTVSDGRRTFIVAVETAAISSRHAREEVLPFPGGRGGSPTRVLEGRSVVPKP